MDTAKTNDAERENAQGAVTDMKTSMKALMANALLLQTRHIVDFGKSAVEIKSRLKEHLQAESAVFTSFPVGAMGSANSIMNRYLLIWCSTSEARCNAQPIDLAERARQATNDASKTRLFESCVDEVKERGRDRLIALETGLARNSQSELDGHPLYATVLEAAQGVWGQPRMAEAPQLRHLSSEQELAGPALTETQLESAQSAYRCGIAKKGSKRQYEEDEQQVADDGEAGSQKKTRTDPSAAGRGMMLEMKDMEWIMSLLSRDNKTEGSEAGVKLPPPPPGHRKTSILKPILSKEPACLPEPPKAFSPLDYQTNVGDATVVHNIYLEARRGTRPRTPAEERSRRKRALKMAYKETIRVINDIEWYRKGLGLGSGVRPSVLIGLKDVPEEEQRPWLFQKLDTLKDRQCKVRYALAETRKLDSTSLRLSMRCWMRVEQEPKGSCSRMSWEVQCRTPFKNNPPHPGRYVKLRATSSLVNVFLIVC